MSYGEGFSRLVAMALEREEATLRELTAASTGSPQPRDFLGVAPTGTLTSTHVPPIPGG